MQTDRTIELVREYFSRASNSDSKGMAEMRDPAFEFDAVHRDVTRADPINAPF